MIKLNRLKRLSDNVHLADHYKIEGYESVCSDRGLGFDKSVVDRLCVKDPVMFDLFSRVAISEFSRVGKVSRIDFKEVSRTVQAIAERAASAGYADIEETEKLGVGDSFVKGSEV